MPPLGCYHQSQIIVKLKCSSFFSEAPRAPPVTPRSLPDTILWKAAWHTSWEQTQTLAMWSLRDLAAQFISPKGSLPCKRCLFSVYAWASLLCVSGAQKANMIFFLAAIRSIIVVQTVWIDPLQQPELFKTTSLTFFPQQIVYIVPDTSSLRQVKFEKRMLTTIWI